MLRPTLAFLAGAALLAGCPTANDDDSAVETTDMAITLNFAAKVGTEDVVCGGSYGAMGSEGTTVQIKDFRAFISGIELLNSDGAMVPLELDQDSPWQVDDLALLDFEDGTGACSETGTAETNMTVTGTVPEGTYTDVAFDLGVPFDRNHGDSATAPSPLNLVAMQWNWQGGYKFVRIDMTNEGAPPMNNWFFHLGNGGLFDVTGRPEDMGKFRAPTLRNVEVTGPYMHDGSMETLEEVVEFYARGGRLIEDGPNAGDGRLNPFKSGFMNGFSLTTQERDDIVAFLTTLTDEDFLVDPAFADPFEE